MRRLSLALISAVSALAFTQIASAADLPRGAPAYMPPPVALYNWTGFYIGGNAGWVGSADDTIDNTGTDTGTNGLGAVLALGYFPASVDSKLSGFIGGGQIGYNWQTGQLVWGLEADIQGVAANSDTTTFRAPIPQLIESSFSRDLTWLATFRGRLGWLATPQFLIYGTGGLAVGETKISLSAFAPDGVPPLNAASESSNTQAGWTAGAGVEWMFAPRWSVKAEYLYVDLGSNDTTISYAYGGFNSTLTSHVNDTFHVVRGGINFHF